MNLFTGRSTPAAAGSAADQEPTDGNVEIIYMYYIIEPHLVAFLETSHSEVSSQSSFSLYTHFCFHQTRTDDDQCTIRIGTANMWRLEIK